MKKVIQTIMDMVCKTNGLMSKFCRILLLVIVSGKMAHNVWRLCVRLRSVGIERSGSLHKTDVTGSGGLIRKNVKIWN